MNNKVSVVEQDPLGPAVALDPHGAPAELLLQLLVYLIRDRLDLTLIRSRRDHEKLREAGNLPQIERDHIDGLFIIGTTNSKLQFGIQLIFTTAGAALATAVMTFPLMVRAIRISLEGVDPGLEDAARTLGAGPWDRFLTITLPLMLPGILAGVVTAFAAGLGEFGAVITFVSNIPGQTRTLPPDGDALAARLAAISFALGIGGLLISELIARRVQRLLGR